MLAEDGPYLVRTQDILSGTFRMAGAAKVSRETYLERIKRAEPTHGDLLYSREGTYFGIAAEVPQGEQVCLGQRMVLIRPDASVVNYRYLRYWLNSSFMASHVHGSKDGSVAARLNLPTIRKLPTLLPRLVEQEAIAATLGALDDKIAVNERIATTAIELADAIYLQAVSGVEPGDETFGSVATVSGGGTPSTKVESYWGGDIAWTTPSDVTALPSPYLFNTGRKVTSDGLEMCASPLYPANSIFMTSRATIGAFALPQIPAAVNQGFIVVTPPDESMRWWLFHEMRSRVPEMISLCNGSTFLELSRRNFKALKVRLLGAEEIEKFARAAAPVHGRAVHAAEENHLLVEIRDTLLPQLMSGRIRVKDAEKIVEDHV